MFEEVTVLSQVTILPEQNAINVQWLKQVKKDGVVIASTPHRKAYIQSQKDEFLNEVTGAANYIAALGW